MFTISEFQMYLRFICIQPLDLQISSEGHMCTSEEGWFVICVRQRRACSICVRQRRAWSYVYVRGGLADFF